MAAGQYRVAAENAVAIGTPRRFGNKIYVYSGRQISGGVGAPRNVLEFENLDGWVEYEITIGQPAGAAVGTDFEVCVTLNGVAIVCILSRNAFGDLLPQKIIVPPRTTVDVSVENTTAPLGEDIFVNFVGTTISNKPCKC